MTKGAWPPVIVRPKSSHAPVVPLVLTASAVADGLVLSVEELVVVVAEESVRVAVAVTVAVSTWWMFVMSFVTVVVSGDVSGVDEVVEMGSADVVEEVVVEAEVVEVVKEVEAVECVRLVVVLVLVVEVVVGTILPTPAVVVVVSERSGVTTSAELSPSSRSSKAEDERCAAAIAVSRMSGR